MSNNTQDQTEHLVGTSFSVGFVAVILIADVVVFLSGVFGNVLLIVVMYKSKVKGFPKVLIGNLALADLVVISTLPYFFLDLILGWHPVVNLTHCRVNAAILNIGYSVSITTLITVSFNRYMKIYHPLAFRRIFTSTRRNLAICGGLWSCGVLANVPGFSPSMTPYNYDPDSHMCITKGDSATANYGKVAMFIFLTIPVILIGYFNVAIYRCWHSSRKKMQQFDPKKEKMRKENRGVGSGNHAASAKYLAREVTAVEVVPDKENPHQTMSTDNEDKKPETHCAAECGSVKREENKAGKSTYTSSTTASNSAPGLRDENMTARNLTSSSTFLWQCETASTSSDSCEIASLFHQTATAVGSKVHGCKDCSDLDVGSMMGADVHTDTVGSAVGSRGSLYGIDSSSKNAYPSNNTNTNIGSNDMTTNSDSANFHPSSGSNALSANSSSKNKAHIHSGSRVDRLCRAKISAKKKKVRPEVALVKSLLVISVTLFVLYTPFCAILLLSFFKVAIPGQVTVISAQLLAANCAVNWIIYGVMNTLFREAYINVLKSLLFCCKR